MTETDTKIRLVSPGSPGGLKIGKFIEPPDKKELLNLLNGDLRCIETGMVLLDTFVPIAGSPPIDILAKDIHGQLTIINFVDGRDASWLPHTINHFDWINKNKYFLSKSFISIKMDHSKPVRVIILLQELLPVIRNTLRFISGIDISFFQLRSYELDNEKLLLLEPILKKEKVVQEDVVPIERKVEKSDVVQPAQPTESPLILSEEEISDFYSEKV